MAIITLVDSCANYRRTITVDNVVGEDNWIFVYSGCIKLAVRPSRDYWVSDTLFTTPADTIYWPPGDTVIVPRKDSVIMRYVMIPDTVTFEDICRPACAKLVNVPLGCWDTLRVETPYEYTKRICDSVCAIVNLTSIDSSYYLLADSTAIALRASVRGCHAPAYNYVSMRRISRDYWVLNHKEFDMNYPRYGAYPDTNYCYLPLSYVQIWVMVNNLSPTILSGVYPDTIPIPCADRGKYVNPIVSITNCRDTTVTGTTVTLTPVFMPAGRDSAVWKDTCGCTIPVSTCEGIWTKTTYWQYIWRIDPHWHCDTTYVDSAKTKMYEYIKGYTLREQRTSLTGSSSAYCDLVNNYYPIYSGVAWQPGYVLVTWNGWTSPCEATVTIACSSNGYVTPGTNHFFMPQFALPSTWLNEIQCLPTACVPVWDTFENWVCDRDTTVTITCVYGEKGNIHSKDSTITFKVPAWRAGDTACVNTYRKIKCYIVGYDSVKVDSIPRDEWHFVGSRYKIVYKDTCACEGWAYAANGRRPWCTIYFRDACGRPIYWVGDTLVFPCDETGAAAMAYAAEVTSLQQHMIDSLRSRVDSLETKTTGSMLNVVAKGDISLDGSGNADLAPAGVESTDLMLLTYHAGNVGTLVPLSYEWTGSNFRIYGTPEVVATYLIFRP